MIKIEYVFFIIIILYIVISFYKLNEKKIRKNKKEKKEDKIIEEKNELIFEDIKINENFKYAIKTFRIIKENQHERFNEEKFNELTNKINPKNSKYISCIQNEIQKINILINKLPLEINHNNGWDDHCQKLNIKSGFYNHSKQNQKENLILDYINSINEISLNECSDKLYIYDLILKSNISHVKMKVVISLLNKSSFKNLILFDIDIKGFYL